MIKSYKVMLLPNDKQRSRLFQFAGTARFAYNWALNKQMKAYEDGEQFISNGELRKEFTILRNSSGYEWLQGISNNVTKKAIKDCCDAYSKFFAKQKRTNIKFTKKKLSHLARLGRSPTVYDMNGHPHNNEELGIRNSELKTLRIKNYALRIKNWWLSVSIEFEETAQDENFNDAIGIDLGVKDLAILSDGTVYQNINKTPTVKRLKKRMRRLQRRISRKYEMNKEEGGSYKKTRSIIKSEKQLLKLHHRLKNIRLNYLHQITTAIVNRKPRLIVLEDLNIQGMMTNRHLSKAVQEQVLYEFRRQITYKAEWSSITVVIADRYYPSSKTCVKCGFVKKDLKLKERVYHCPQCGNEIDRDLQAAMNLKLYGESQ